MAGQKQRKPKLFYYLQIISILLSQQEMETLIHAFIFISRGTVYGSFLLVSFAE